MKEKIRRITEAFSTLPKTFTVVSERSMFSPEDDIERMELEVFDEHTTVYVGYDFEGKKKFQCLSNSMNVEYF